MLLHHALRGIVVERRFGALPRVAVYVDELNQVWTNLIQNAQYAVTSRAGGGGKIAVETASLPANAEPSQSTYRLTVRSTTSRGMLSKSSCAAKVASVRLG